MQSEKEKDTSVREASVEEEVFIDYPEEGEEVLPGNYTVRISGPENAEVELSVDGGPWQGCRASAGYYWYDWQPADPGQHEIKARVRLGESWTESSPRECAVIGPSVS